MNDLTIEVDRVPVSRQFLGAVREEFAAAGLNFGRFAVCDLSAEPSMVSFRWHEGEESEISTTVDRQCCKSEEQARSAARIFLFEWQKRARTGVV